MEREMLLEKYLEEELTEEERKEFEMLLKSDADFSREVKFHADLKRVTESDDDDNFKEMLSDFEAEARMEKPSVKKSPTKWLVAASISLLAGLTYFFNVDQFASTQDLFADNFKPYPNLVHRIVRSGEAQDKKIKAFSAYQTGAYIEALPMFTELYASDKEPYYLFYSANALIELNRAREAVPMLQEHLRITQITDTLVEKSPWYLAMAYLQLDEKENAIKMLNAVIKNGTYKVDDAQKLLNALE